MMHNSTFRAASLSRIAGQAGLVVFSIITALLIGELLTRLFFPRLAPPREGRVEFWVYDDTLGWAHRPNQKDRFTHPEFDVEVSINSHGLRDSEFDPKASSKKRMIVLGDSFGWGFGVEHGDRFDSLLERRHPEWELVNASVSGYGTDQQYLWLLANGEKYNPDAVMVLLYQNDFSNNFSKDQYWHFKPRFLLENGELVLDNTPVPETSFQQHIQRLIVGRTYLFGYIYRSVLYPLNIRRAVAQQQAKQSQGLTSARKYTPLELTGALLSEIQAYCARIDARFILVSVPGEERFRDFLKDYSAEHGFDYLPLDSKFAEVDISEYVFRRDNHWNEVGHSIAADAIDAYFRELGIF